MSVTVTASNSTDPAAAEADRDRGPVTTARNQQPPRRRADDRVAEAFETMWPPSEAAALELLAEDAPPTGFEDGSPDSVSEC